MLGKQRTISAHTLKCEVHQVSTLGGCGKLGALNGGSIGLLNRRRGG